MAIEDNILLIKNWDNFLSLVYSHGIFPLVYKTLKNNTQISSKVQNSMKYLNMNIVKQNMLMTSELLNVSKLLEENGINAISFKGPVLSQMAYGDVVSRQYCDLDILVEKKDLKKTINLLLENDYINILPLEIISNEICLEVIKDFTIVNEKSKTNIEIHWNLFESKYDLTFKNLGDIEFINILINQNEIKTISKEILLVYLCFHGSKHAWERIEWISDIDRFIRNNQIDFSNIGIFLEYNSFKLGLYLSNLLFDTPLDKSILEKVSNENIKKLSTRVFEIYLDKKYFEDEKYYHKVLFKFQVSLVDSVFEKLIYHFEHLFAISNKDVQTFYKVKNKYYFIFLRPFRLVSSVFKKNID